jgi:glycosyltransferase involved in cell wall biosynthesis
MKFSIVICTRNRAEELKRTLSSLCELSLPPDFFWEVLVVNNGSTDHTAAVVAGFAYRLPIRNVIEPVAGLSVARNTAVRSVRGDYVLWIDDDVTPERDWLEKMVLAVRGNPDVAFLGGTIEPILMEPRAELFCLGSDALRDLLARRDPAGLPARVTADYLPYGANFGVRTATLRQHPFDPTLGVAPNRNRGGEETAVLKAILAEGGTGLWVPEAKVRHWIPVERQTLTYITKFYRGAGAELVFRLNLNTWSKRSRAMGFYAAKALKAYGRYRLSRSKQHPNVWLNHYARYCVSIGVVSFLLSRENP